MRVTLTGQHVLSAATACSLQIRLAFYHFDTDRSGELDVRELKSALAKLGLESTGAEVVQIMRKYDSAGDGTINLLEFSKLVADLRAYFASKPPAPAPPPSLPGFDGPHSDRFLSGYARDMGKKYATLNEAAEAALADSSASGVTMEKAGVYTVRRRRMLSASSSGEVSWRKAEPTVEDAVSYGFMRT